MCGRYASTRSRDELIETFDIPVERADPLLPADYNVAPTKTAPVVVARPPRRIVMPIRSGSCGICAGGRSHPSQRSQDRITDDQRPLRLIQLNWQIGRVLLDQTGRAQWGDKVIGRLAADLRAEFPGLRGFSVRKLLYMRSFAQAWGDCATACCAIALGHITVLLDKIDD